MKPVYPIYLTFFLLFYCYLQVEGLANTITSQRIDKECLFNKETARMIGEIYVLSNPMNDPNELVQYIQDHLEYFLDDGIAVKSARALGNWMLEQNKTSLDKETIHQVGCRRWNFAQDEHIAWFLNSLPSMRINRLT